MHASQVRGRLLGVTAVCTRAVTCLYTVTPGFGFVIDRHPEWERVLVASPCSGHGFKHSAAIGEALAERATAGTSRLDLSPFSLERFGTNHERHHSEARPRTASGAWLLQGDLSVFD
jgi:sarcosine oxidase